MTNLVRRTSRLAAGFGIAGGTLLLLAGPAAADTSAARATAATVKLLNASLVDTGVVSATNNGTTQTKTGQNTTSVLGGQTLVTAGVFAQDAVARSNGTSSACAGAVGSGGQIQVGTAPGCTVTLGTPNGVSVNLSNGVLNGLPGLGNVATLGADAIYAQCNATTTGTPTGSATLVNANIFVLGTPLPINLATAPAPNQGVTVPGIANIILNEQIVSGTTNNILTVNALHITLLPFGGLGSPLADIVIGSVTCGPNAAVAAVSLFAGPALPVALTAAAGIGAVAVMRRRRPTV